MTLGRPSSYTPEKAEAICARLANGESLRSICDGDDMPERVTVYRWLQAREDFRVQYARAKQFGIDSMADDIQRIADTPLEGVELVVKADGGVEERRGDMLGHRRLQVDSRKWLLSKLAPKKYGDKLELSGDAENPLQVVVKQLTPKKE